MTVKLTAPGQAAITAKKSVNETQPGTEADVAIPLPKVPAAGTAATLVVRVEPVRGEENTDNNQGTYTVLFRELIALRDAAGRPILRAPWTT